MSYLLNDTFDEIKFVTSDDDLLSLIQGAQRC